MMLGSHLNESDIENLAKGIEKALKNYQKE